MAKSLVNLNKTDLSIIMILFTGHGTPKYNIKNIDRVAINVFATYRNSKSQYVRLCGSSL